MEFNSAFKGLMELLNPLNTMRFFNSNFCCPKDEYANRRSIIIQWLSTTARGLKTDCSIAITYELLQESFLLPVPSFSSGNMARPVSPLTEETEAGSEEGDPDAGGSGSGSGSGSGGGSAWRRTGTTSTSSSALRGAQSGQLKTTSSLLRKCYPSSSTQVPFLPAGRLEDCLPPCYHGTKTMAKLIKVSS